MEFSNEPAIRDRATLETLDGSKADRREGTVANLTPEEVWLALGESMEGLLAPGTPVRLILVGSDHELEAETAVRRFVGGSGRMVAVLRPQAWITSSRRANGRVPLAIPGYLHPAEGMVVPVRTTNISVGGFHCVTDLAVSIGHEMPVSLMLTPTEPFECRAQVVRIDDDPADPSLRQSVVAFRFVDLRVADDARIAAALADLGDDTDSVAIPTAWRSVGRPDRLAP